MATTKITSFPSLHSDQGHGLTKVWSPQEKQQITKPPPKKERLKVDHGKEVGGKGAPGLLLPSSSTLICELHALCELLY